MGAAMCKKEQQSNHRKTRGAMMDNEVTDATASRAKMVANGRM